MNTLLDGKRIRLGTCYYPEHWAKENWKSDLNRMLDVGIEVIRIAEFAWTKIEPEERQFDYTFFDEFLNLVEQTEMKVIFCTPTATPPVWLTEKYPEVLNADIDGSLFYGPRRHYNYNSEIYKTMSARITEKVAAHYAKRACIIGWQIDNELNCEKNVFYSESDTAAFRLFLQEKYGTLDVLNAAWGTVFWNQTYTKWEQIHVPRKSYNNTVNPHLALDYSRFVSDSARKFCHMQSEILRIYIKPGDFITTNGMFDHLDNHQMTEESLDFYTYDSYPNFAYCLDRYRDDGMDLQDRKWSRNLSEVRSVSPIFGIMEQQSGANGWTSRMEAPTPRPGQMTLWTMQSIAHGADFVSYFRWRTCTFGTEMYWHGILDYSGRDNRRLREVKEIHKKLQQISAVAGAHYEAQVGILRDYDNIWDSRQDRWHERIEEASRKAFFEAAQRSHTPMDYVYLDHADLKKLMQYKVLIYPHMTIVTEEAAARLSAYVEAGGILVIGCRSGYKDATGKCVTTKLPGLLGELTGTDIPEYSLIAPDAGKVTIDWEGTTIEAAVFADLLEPVHGGVAEAVYTSDYYAGSGALVGRQYGKGKAYYYGSAWTEETAGIFLEKLGVCTPYAACVEAPKCCEIAVRKKGETRYLFVLNYAKHGAVFTLKKNGVDLYTGKKVSGEITLDGYGTAVIKL